MLLQSLASIPQISQSIFQINRAEIALHSAKRKTVCSEHCHVVRGEKCPDASRMFAMKSRERRDLNTDISVFDWQVRLWLAPCWRLAVTKGLREHCRDVGRAPARKIYTVICYRSGQHYLKSDGPMYLSLARTGQWKIKCTGPNWSGGLKSVPGQRASAYVEGWNEQVCQGGKVWRALSCPSDWILRYIKHTFS